MNKSLFALGLVVLLSVCGPSGSNPVEWLNETPFLVGSFNLKNYGPTKAGRPEYVNTVARILAKYDIALVQEVQDVSETIAIPTLLNAINDYVRDAEIVYDYHKSPRLGFSSRKEQYVVFYRKHSKEQEIGVVKDFVFSNEKQIYERPPHTVKFKVVSKKLSTLKEFYLANIHTRPTDVLYEVLAFNDVLDELVELEGLADPKNYNVAIVGDYNFGCTYISAKDRDLVRAALGRFSWYISDSNPTTISKSGCAYDRIMVSGDKFKSAIYPHSNRTYRYDLEFGLDATQTAAISDHYPIEFQLY